MSTNRFSSSPMFEEVKLFFVFVYDSTSYRFSTDCQIKQAIEWHFIEENN